LDSVAAYLKPELGYTEKGLQTSALTSTKLQEENAKQPTFVGLLNIADLLGQRERSVMKVQAVAATAASKMGQSTARIATASFIGMHGS